MDTPLDAASVRVLGCLIEKESTTPDTYPLTLNGLTAACNQTSNRDPVMHLDEDTVARSLDELSRRKLARGVQRSDSRVPRYRHLMTESLSLHQSEIAVMGVLMLRGAQTVGEIRTRAARIFEFPDLARVELALQSLMSLSQPLVAQLPRRPGHKELRYAHLLSGPPEENAAEPVAAVRASADDGRVAVLERQVAALEVQVAELRSQLDELRSAFS